MRLLLLTFLASFSLLLSGCGAEERFPGDPYAPGAGPEAGGSMATGGAAKGILKNAEVVVEMRMGSGWVFRSSTTTDENGRFELNLLGIDGPVRVTLTAGPNTEMICDIPACAAEEVDRFGQFVRLGDYSEYLGNGFILKAILPSGSATETFSVSPLTTMAALWVESLPGDVAVNTVAVERALSRVADLFGLDGNFYAQLPVDITNPEAVAGKASIQAELLSAAFVMQGADGAPLPIEESLSAIVGNFVQLGGQLGLSQDAQDLLGNSADAIVRRALEVAGILGSAALGDTSKLDEVTASLNGLLQDWGTEAAVTSAQGNDAYQHFTSDEKAKFDQSKALFNQLEKYFIDAGVTADGTFIEKHRQQLNWLYKEEGARADTAGLIGAVGQIAIQAVIGTLQEGLSCLAQAADPQGLIACGGNTLTFDGSTINFPADAAATIPHSIDVAITLPVFTLSSLDDLETLFSDMTFTLENIEGGGKASIENSTARGELEGQLVVNLAKADTTELGITDILRSLFNDPNVLVSLGEDGLLAALMNTELDIKLVLDGSLERLSASAEDDLVKQGESFIVHLDASLNANLSAVSFSYENGIPRFDLSDTAPLLTGVINSGLFKTPRGDFLADLKDEPFCNFDGQVRDTLRVVAANTSTAEGCFSAKLAELPEMQLAFAGELGGAVNLLNQLIAGLMGTDPLAGVIDALDVESLNLLGSAKLKILDLAEGNKNYGFSLNRNRVDVTDTDTGDQVQIYLSSLEGGHLVNNGVWVGTFRFDWVNLGIRIQLADGTDETFALGNILGVIEPELLELVMDSLLSLGLGGLSLSLPL